jgi:hypothetical protein
MTMIEHSAEPPSGFGSLHLQRARAASARRCPLDKKWNACLELLFGDVSPRRSLNRS